jgi:hypothetical protein
MASEESLENCHYVLIQLVSVIFSLGGPQGLGLRVIPNPGTTPRHMRHEHQNNLAATVKKAVQLGHTINRGVPRLFDISVVGNNFSQAPRDGIDFAGCDKESQFSDRAGLVEKLKKIGWEKCTDTKEFVYRTREW